jgi:hypothetical protein
MIQMVIWEAGIHYNQAKEEDHNQQYGTPQARN